MPGGGSAQPPPPVRGTSPGLRDPLVYGPRLAVQHPPGLQRPGAKPSKVFRAGTPTDEPYPAAAPGTPSRLSRNHVPARPPVAPLARPGKPRAPTARPTQGPTPSRARRRRRQHPGGAGGGGSGPRYPLPVWPGVGRGTAAPLHILLLALPAPSPLHHRHDPLPPVQGYRELRARFVTQPPWHPCDHPVFLRIQYGKGAYTERSANWLLVEGDRQIENDPTNTVRHRHIQGQQRPR